MSEQSITLPMPPYLFVCYECFIALAKTDKPEYCDNCGGSKTFHRYELASGATPQEASDG